jgi:peptide/nickel transport system substrate-binding protein
MDDSGNPIRPLSRRRFLTLVGLGGTAALAAACAQPAPPAPTAAPAAPTTAPAAAPTAAPTTPPTAAAAAKPTVAPTPTTGPAATAGPTAAAAAGPIKEIPRNQTLVMVRGGTDGKFIEYNIWNPFLPAGNHQLGSLYVHEPLAFYSAFQDKEILWLAESYQFTPDYRQLTIKTRPGITWSDGQPFSSADVEYTFQQLLKNSTKVKWGADVAEVLDSVQATDPNTTVFKFKVPAPRFFRFISYKFDIGVYIVPKHVFQDQDFTTFTHWDPAKGWPVTTSPWRVVYSAPEQKIMDNAGQWWGEKAGIGQLPQMQRIVYLPDPKEQAMIQGLVSNQFDLTTGLQPTSFKAVFDGNPEVSTWTGKESPYGYMDWWPHSLYVNTTKAPWDDPEVRWAISSYLNRDVIIDVAWEGAASTAALPMPEYPPTKPFFDALKTDLQTYNTLEFAPEKGDAILQKKGWKKGSDGMWLDASGKPVQLDIISFFDFTSVGPVVVEQFKQAGISATYSEPPNMFDRLSSGDYTGALFGHGGSYGDDPYYTLRLYQSSSQAIPGGHLVNFSLWKSAEFDKITDEMYGTSPTERDKILDQWTRAMRIWLPNLPDIMIEQGYHRLPQNEHYWKGWPTAQDPYVNTAHWHLTAPLWVHRLTPTGAA